MYVHNLCKFWVFTVIKPHSVHSVRRGCISCRRNMGPKGTSVRGKRGKGNVRKEMRRKEKKEESSNNNIKQRRRKWGGGGAGGIRPPPTPYKKSSKEVKMVCILNQKEHKKEQNLIWITYKLYSIQRKGKLIGIKFRIHSACSYILSMEVFYKICDLRISWKYCKRMGKCFFFCIAEWVKKKFTPRKLLIILKVIYEK